MRLPDGFRIAFDRNLRRVGDGTVLIGGSPIRLIRLTPAGRDLATRLAAGDTVPRSPAAQSLTRRLLDAGLAHPRPPATTAPAVAVVIPVRNDPAGLATTLTALPVQAGADDAGAGSCRRSITVVDDLSSEPDRIAAACSRAGATLIRRTAWGGPGAARNDGWRATDEPLVAFLDADCEPEPAWLERLLPHFADPRVAAVAPRIVPPTGPAQAGANGEGSRDAGRPPTPRPGARAAYEAIASPLDLGAREAIVRPRSPVAYVPTAALVVRRRALEELGGFDEALRVGEDVDFVWRLVAAGWTVRYEPRATVRHPIRPGWRAWLRQRYRYGTSAAPLARRHGPAVAPAAVSPWTVAAWTLVAAGHPALGATAASYSVAALAGRRPHRRNGLPPDIRHPAQPPTGPRLEPDTSPGAGRDAARVPVTAAVRLAGLGHLRGGLALARAVRRAWAPAAVLLAVASRRSRPALAAVAVIPGLLQWVERRPRLDPARFVALGLADDLAYAAGVWAGCARERSARALVPDLRSARRHPLRQTYQPLSASIGGRG